MGSGVKLVFWKILPHSSCPKNEKKKNFSPSSLDACGSFLSVVSFKAFQGFFITKATLMPDYIMS